MGFTDTDICSQCTLGVTDTYIHALWECSPVQAFWHSVTQKLTEILNCRIPSCSSLCLLGHISLENFSPMYKNSLLTSLAIAKRIILQNWKSKQAIHINHWTNSLKDHISTLLIAASYNNDMQTLLENWKPFLNYYSIQIHSQDKL